MKQHDHTTELTVDDLPPHGIGIVRDIRTESPVTRRLMDMGVIEGASVEMVRSAPFGDPLLIRVRNAVFALRRSDARRIVIEYTGERDHVRHRHRFGGKSKQR